MCGIVGWFNASGEHLPIDRIETMADCLRHRGPDSGGQFMDTHAALAVRRLKIIDPDHGDQPHRSEDGLVVSVCNGEVFNATALRRELTHDAHVFGSRVDTEVLVHLYEEHGANLVDHLNGQFGLAVYDARARRLVLARDHFGVVPLFYTIVGSTVVFGSEIKALLEFPGVRRQVDLAGLDQVLSLPGLVSPRTMFDGIMAMRPGERLVADSRGMVLTQYWDAEYPPASSVSEWGADSQDEDAFEAAAGTLRSRLDAAVERRMQADVPIGVYLSGGLDSSLLATVLARRAVGDVHSFGVDVRSGHRLSEVEYQRLAALHAGTIHHEVPIDIADIEADLQTVVRHTECPLRETYDACALRLSRAAREAGCFVVLSGQGADELFGGYPGYRLARSRSTAASGGTAVLEREFRKRMWGDDVFYEQDQLPLREIRRFLYAPDLIAQLPDFEVTTQRLVDPDQVVGRAALHKRSYLDLRLRLADHLLGDHGDRMVMANGVEGRMPFLDLDVFGLAAKLPAQWMVRGDREKALLRRAAVGLVPQQVLDRPKFGFRAPGSPELLASGVGWFRSLLAPSLIKRHGYFSPSAVSSLVEHNLSRTSVLDPHIETDWLMMVATFSLFVEEFGLPCLG